MCILFAISMDCFCTPKYNATWQKWPAHPSKLTKTKTLISVDFMSMSHVRGGGVFNKFCTGMLKVDIRISTISIPWEAWFLTISIPNCLKNQVIRNKLGAFLANFSKIRPILQIERIGSGTETHSSIYQIWWKSALKPLSIPYIFNQWEPPPFSASMSPTKTLRFN